VTALLREHKRSLLVEAKVRMNLPQIAKCRGTVAHVLSMAMDARAWEVLATVAHRMLLVQLVIAFESEFGLPPSIKGKLTARAFRQGHKALREDLKDFTNKILENPSPELMEYLQIGAHRDISKVLKEKLKVGTRLLRLAQHIGWVVIVAGDWMNRDWFERVTDGEWTVIESRILSGRQFIREEAIQILGIDDARWMLQFPLCTSFPLPVLTGRRRSIPLLDSA